MNFYTSPEVFGTNIYLDCREEIKYILDMAKTFRKVSDCCIE